MSEARRFARLTAGRWGIDATAVASIVSEFASNAVKHARTPFTVVLTQHADTVRIEVSDESAVPPVMDDYPLWAFAGRGLAIVAVAADRWGYELKKNGKTVWAEVTT